MSLVKRMLSLVRLAVFAALSMNANAQLADKKFLHSKVRRKSPRLRKPKPGRTTGT